MFYYNFGICEQIYIFPKDSRGNVLCSLCTIMKTPNLMGCIAILLFESWRFNRARLRRCQRLRYLDDTDAVCVDELLQFADDKLFEKIVHNSAHVLQPLIPDRPLSSYDFRPRIHDKRLLDKTSYLNDHEFVTRICCIQTQLLTMYLSMNYVLIFTPRALRS